MLFTGARERLTTGIHREGATRWMLDAECLCVEIMSDAHFFRLCAQVGSNRDLVQSAYFWYLTTIGALYSLIPRMTQYHV